MYNSNNNNNNPKNGSFKILIFLITKCNLIIKNISLLIT